MKERTGADAGLRRSRDFRPDINGLRAIAVIAVVLFHFGVPGSAGGFVGVDVFFVISGFLMTKIIVGGLDNGTFCAKRFLSARVRRLLPALWTLCAALLALGWLSLGPMRYASLSRHAASSLAFVSNFAFGRESGYFAPHAGENWLLHTWSLSVEWQFYLLFPFALMLAAKLSRSKASFAAMLLLLFTASLGFSIFATRLHPTYAYYSFCARAWELAAGGLTYLSAPLVPKARLPRAAAELAGLALIAGGATLLSPRDPWPGHLALVPVLGAASVILAGNARSPLTGNRAFQFIGTASYSIYLWHWPVRVAFRLEHLPASPAAQTAGILLSVVLGYASYRFVETPLRRPWRGALGPLQASGHAAAWAGLVGAALLVSRLDGLPSRLHAGRRPYLTAEKAVEDWKHPGPNCAYEAYAARCFSPGKGGDLAMFIGDSHAEQWYPRYGGARPDKAFSTLFVTHDGCLPVRGINGNDTVAGSGCARFAAQAWKEAFERRPRILVVASIWLTYFYGARGEPKYSLCVLHGPRCDYPAPRALLRDVFTRLTADVERARARGSEVIIVGPTPWTGVDYARERLSQLAEQALPIGLGRPDPDGPVASSYAVNPSAYGRGKIETLLRGVARKAGARFVSPSRYMCPRRRCSYVDRSGAPIYKDESHLRASYVRSDGARWLDEALGIRG